MLMRARYSAFAVGDAAFLIRTGLPSAERPDPAGLIDPALTWTGLHITGSTGGGLLEDRGTVEFSARWARSGGERGVLREHSRFARVDGRWRYLGPVPFQV